MGFRVWAETGSLLQKGLACRVRGFKGLGLEDFAKGMQWPKNSTVENQLEQNMDMK